MAFYSMDALKTITFEDGSLVEELTGRSFSSNKNLEYVIFAGNSKLKTIKEEAFAHDPKLKSFEFPASVTDIKQSAFLDTPSMTTVTFKTPASITTIGQGAFAYSGITAIDLPESVTKIEQQAFDNCKGLKTVNIPANLNDIAIGAFNMCEGMLEFTVDAGNTKYKALDGMLCDNTKTKLVVFPAGKADTKYTLVPYFNSVEPYAFYGSKKVTNITFPSTITSIGTHAIALCQNLKSMSFMGVDQVPELTEDILYQSSNVKDVTIYVRKGWFENDANQTKVQKYKNTFKDVHPSFVPSTDYDRGTEFFPTSDDNVGAISFYNERTSVIINPTATETGYTDKYGTVRPTKTYDVSSVLDFAYENTDTVKAIVLLADVSYVGMNAFKGNSIKEIYFVGKTPAELGSVNYEQPGSYEFKENQAIYVRPSVVQDYQNKWQVNSHVLGITSEIPVSTSNEGGSLCYPFDVKLPNDKGQNDIKPYVPLKYTHVYDAVNPFVRAVSIDDYYVPAFTGVLIRSKETPNVSSYCQMDEDQNHVMTTITGLGYSTTAADNYLVGAAKDIIISNESGYQYYAFSKSRGKFVKLKDGATFPYFKSYFRLKNNTAAPANGFTIVFDDDMPTDIDGVTEFDNAGDNEPYYNLNGMRVENPEKGIYIHCGKKVIIK